MNFFTIIEFIRKPQYCQNSPEREQVSKMVGKKKKSADLSIEKGTQPMPNTHTRTHTCTPTQST